VEISGYDGKKKKVKYWPFSPFGSKLGRKYDLMQLAHSISS